MYGRHGRGKRALSLAWLPPSPLRHQQPLYAGAFATKLVRWRVPKPTYLIGDVACTGDVYAVNGMGHKLTQAARAARGNGAAQQASVIFPDGNVKHKMLVDADGRRVEVAKADLACLRLVPVKTDVEAMAALFWEGAGACVRLSSDGGVCSRRWGLKSAKQNKKHPHVLIDSTKLH